MATLFGASSRGFSGLREGDFFGRDSLKRGLELINPGPLLLLTPLIKEGAAQNFLFAILLCFCSLDTSNKQIRRAAHADILPVTFFKTDCLDF